jgi:ferritin-like metal-binding protein YciE
MKTRYSSAEAGTRPRISTEGCNVHEEIIDWLKDAYAMERSMETSLQKHTKNDDLSPEVRSRASQHLEETRRHAEQIRTALEGLGADVSALKTSIGIMTEGTKGLLTAFARDERIKDILNAYSMEHFEIACYLALIAATEQAGLLQVAEICRGILADEERMAHSLRGSLPEEVSQYLATAR